MAGRKPRLIALFDVDGTLTAARKDVTPGMLKFMSDLRKAAHLQFRGQRIWSAAMEELMSQGTRYARQALLSGCSGGGLASILHCDEFGNLFHGNVKVKCLSDAGLFLDAVDVSGGRPLRKFFGGVVNVAVLKSLPYV